VRNDQIAQREVRAAVVGAGVFGVSAAVRLAEAGHEVTLFDQHPEILRGASGANQFRLHRGYHYPRDPDGASTFRDSFDRFRSWFGDAILDLGAHVYSIAREESRTSADAFLAFLDAVDLPYREVRIPHVDASATDLSIEVDESSIDPKVLADRCAWHLQRVHVAPRLGAPVERETLGQYDAVVVCGYADTNSVVPEHLRRPYQFEVCEKPVFSVPSSLVDLSIVVLDGPFGCIDPWGHTGLSLMGHVDHAVLSRNVGDTPVVPPLIAPLLGAGVVEPLADSRALMIRDANAMFIPALTAARHVGSLYAIRAVLPFTDDTDARPTLIDRIDERTWTIFSGKIITCASAADQVLKAIEEA
jgi:hypothetical protein